MTEDLIKEARALPEAFRKVQLEESRYLEEDALAELDAVGYSAVVLAQKLADALEAATTEWEYGHEGDTLIGVHANASREQAIEDAADLTRHWEPHGKRFRAVRRRKAGPWLPVEGGSGDEA